MRSSAAARLPVSAASSPGVRPLDRRWVVLLAAALAAATIGGGAVALGVFNKNEPKPPIENRPDAAPSTALPTAAPPAASSLPQKLQPMPPGDGKPKPGMP
jgi:hypothetical protein